MNRFTSSPDFSFESLRLRSLLLAGVLLWAAAVARGQETGETAASSGSSAPQSSGGSAAGSSAQSVPSASVPGVLLLSLQDAIDRGLKQNLGPLFSAANITASQGQHLEQLSTLLPNVSASPYLASSKINLTELGISSQLSGLGALAPSASVGPFNYFDAKVSVEQSLFNWKAINGNRASNQSVKSAQYAYQDARDVVVLAVGNVYLVVTADAARIDTSTAQVITAQAIYDQATDQVTAGTSPDIDALRAKVQLQTREQQLIQDRNNYSIQKLVLARAIGLAPGQEFDLADKSPYQLFPGITLDEALTRAYRSRADYQAALADVRGAEYARKAAGAGYLPSLAFNADYGVAGANPVSASQVFEARGTLVVPIFQGRTVRGDILQADARLEQSREQMESLRAQIDADVRTALLNLQSSSDLVAVARSNMNLAQESLRQSRDRFAAGVTNTVEVVQAQEAVASANEQYIESLYSFNLAKLSLARALGAAETGVKEYFQGK
jgi:outer membrane protein TolC